MEFFRNDFVVEVRNTAFGWQSFRVISTRAGIRRMIESLGAALERPETELRPEHLPCSAPTPLWQEYVTQAFRGSDRKVLTFEIVPDLEKYHRWSRKDTGEFSPTTFYTLTIGLSVCAFIGAGWLLFRMVTWLAH